MKNVRQFGLFKKIILGCTVNKAKNSHFHCTADTPSEILLLSFYVCWSHRLPSIE